MQKILVTYIPILSTASTQYIVTVSDTKGCDRQDTVNVIVNPKPIINAGANQTICAGVGVQVGNPATGSSGYQYAWSPATGLSATNIAQPTATPAVQTTYKVVVTDANGCKDSSETTVTVRQPAATLSRTNVDFGILGACDPSKEESITITNTGSDDMIINRQQVPAGFVLVTPLPLTIAKNGTQTVVLRYAPVAQGLSQGTVTLTSDPCDYALTLQLRGEKLQLAYSTDKQSIPYGVSLACSGSVQWDSVVTIRNTGTDKMTVTSATVGSAFSIVTPTFPQDINPGASLPVTVRYAPVSQGTFSDDVRFAFTAGTCTNEIRVPLSALHIIPDAGVTPPSMVFPQMLGCDTRRDTTITISNTNAVDVTVESIVGDAQFKVLTALPLTIPVGENRRIQLRFEPSGTGTVNTNLTITTNPCNRQSPFAVSGSKQGVSFVVADTVDLGTILPCAQSSITRRVVLRNTSGGGVNGVVVNSSTTSGFTTTLKQGDGLPNNQDVNFDITFIPNATTPIGRTIGKVDFGLSPCDVSKSIVVQVTTVELSVAADPAIDFGSVQTGTNRSRTVNIVNKGTADMVLSSLTGLAAPLSIGTVTPPLPATLKSGDTLRVEVLFASQTGKFTQTLTASGTQPCAVSSTTIINAEGTDKPIPSITGIGKNVGDVGIGNSRTDAVSITNDGTVAMNLTAASFDGTSNPAFSIPVGQFPMSLNVGETKQITFTFSPTVVGTASGLMIITGDQDTASATVSGRGVDTVQARPSITAISSLSYDTVCVGQPKQLVVAIRNNGNEDVQLQSANWLTATNNPYTLVGFSPQLLRAGASMNVDIVFQPTTPGQFTNSLQWVGDKATASTAFNGIGKICAAPSPDTVRTTTEVSRIEAKAGERVKIHLVLSEKQKLTLANAPTQYEARLRLNKTILFVDDPSVSCVTVDGNTCELILRGVRGTSDTLASFSGLVTLGNTDYTEIELTKFVWQDTVLTTEVQVRNGSIRVTGVCEEGSVRLVIPTGAT
ncbi:MAG: choice-of-anchor D domain-containing protein, partial [Candidatus Kapabacteria bacterium]|nr:choice-of-anchor D domain-containing protein [Candidatus Kapabacteria bacterium]